MPLIYHAAWSPELVRELIRRGFDVNGVGVNGKRALHQAAHGRDPGSAQTAALLIDAGAEMEAKDEDGNTALHDSADNPEVLQVLISRHAQIDALNSRRQSSLHIAVARRNTDSIRLLIAAGADPNLADASGNKPIHFAARNGAFPPKSIPNNDLSFIEALTGAGADMNAVDAQGKTLLDIAISREEQETKLVQWLMAHGAQRGALTAPATLP